MCSIISIYRRHVGMQTNCAFPDFRLVYITIPLFQGPALVVPLLCDYQLLE